MRGILTGLVLAAVAVAVTGLGLVFAQPVDLTTVMLRDDGVPLPGFEVWVNEIDVGKQFQGATDSDGRLRLDFSQFDERIEIAVDTCPGGPEIVFNLPGAIADATCNSRVLGFWNGEGTEIIIDTGAGTVQSIGNSFFSPLNVGIIGGAAAGVGLGLALKGDGDNALPGQTQRPPDTSPTMTPAPQPTSAPTPSPSPTGGPSTPNISGTYVITTIVLAGDPSNQHTNIRMDRAVGFQVNVVVDDIGTILFDCDTPWIDVEGPFGQDLNFTTTGSGRAGNNPNVGASFIGSATITGNETRVVGVVNVGTNGEYSNGPTGYDAVMVKNGN